jgi:hypothetical protein
MANLKLTRIIPIALILIIVAIAIAALITLARTIFFSGSTSTVSQTDISKEALLSSDSDHAVLFSARGPIIANESFKTYQIKITPSSRVLTMYKGYSGQVVDKISLDNNISSYQQFIFALYKANLVKGSELTGDSNDTRGVCATGSVYEFTVMAGNDTVKQLWTSTCSGSKGSLSASADQLISLFTAQIPNIKETLSKSL